MQTSEITPSRIPEAELFIKRAYENNPGATEKKQKLVEILNEESFDHNKFAREVENWNEAVMRTKGLKGQSGEIETIRGKNGKLKIYYFNGSQSIKFGYDLSK